MNNDNMSGEVLQHDEYSGSGSGFESGSGSGSGDIEEDTRQLSLYIPLCIVAAIIVVVNSLIVVLVWRNVKLRTNCNALLVSLAVADGSTGLFGIPLLAILHITRESFTDKEFLFLVLAQHTWFWFLAIVSMFHLLVIACEQYLAILKPFNHDKIVTRTSTTITLAIIWLVSIGHSLIQWIWHGYFGHGNYEDETIERNDRIYKIFSIIFFFCLPIAIIFFVYYRIVSEAKRQLGRIKRESVGPKTKFFPSCTRYRGFYIIALMWIVFVLCWAPYFGAVLYETYRKIEDDRIHTAMLVLRFLPSVLNPIMFAFWRSDFRAACIEKFCCCVKPTDWRSSMSGSGKQQIPLVTRENRLSDSKQIQNV